MELEQEFQLPLYQLGIGLENVKLCWYFLKFQKRIEITKTKNELKIIKNNIIGKIINIEKEKDFPKTKSWFCNFCGFKKICK